MINRAILILLVCCAAALMTAAEQTKPAEPAAESAAESAAGKSSEKEVDYASHQWLNDFPEKAVYPSLLHRGFYSEANEELVGYCIYLPPGYNDPENEERKYPVVYMLHGGRPGSELKLLPMLEFIHPKMELGEVPPMIYVFANGGAMSHYDYPRLESFGETSFFKELIPQVDANYRTLKKREGRGLEGGSQGGRGTARYMFKHPELFVSAVPMFGGHATEKAISENGGAESEKVVFEPGNNTWDLARTYVENPDPAGPLKVLVVVGDKDFNYEGNLEWMEHLKALGIPFEKRIVPGAGHSYREVYEKAGLEIMNFHAANFRESLGGEW